MLTHLGMARHVFYDKDEGGGGPEGQDDQKPTDGEQDKDGKLKTITQDEANKLIGAARKDGRAAAEKALLEKLGVKSAEEAEAALASFRKTEEEKLNEIEKANRGKEEAEAKVKELEAAKVKADRYQAALTKQLEAAKASLPKYILPLIEKMEPDEALNYIAENSAEFGTTADPIKPTPKGGGKKLTDDEKAEAKRATANLVQRSF